MMDLVEVLERRAVRGTPRGADAVFEAAVHAAPAEFVGLAPSAPEGGVTRRFTKMLLAAAASIMLVTGGLVILGRVSDDRRAGGLHDVNTEEALPLAQAALITPDKIGSRYRRLDPLTDADYARLGAATVASLPDCAALASYGLFSPTTKSVAARESFTRGNFFDLRHTVFVFASEEDASRAMDMIASDTYRTCWFDLFDRLAPLGQNGALHSAVSEPWDAPQLSPHGDRQIVLGQRVTYTSDSGTFGASIFNTYVQVGRSISWIAPALLTTVGQDTPLQQIDEMVGATSAALEDVFGP